MCKITKNLKVVKNKERKRLKMNIYEETKFLMKKYNISANKDLGQNFLMMIM